MTNKTKLKVSSLKSHIGYRLRIVSNAVSHSFAQQLEATGVTVAEWVILREMYSVDDKISSSAIAEMTGLTRGAVSKLIDRLLNKALVTRMESSSDRRYQEISLTAKALKLVPKLGSIADTNDEKFFSILNETEKRNLMNILLKMAEFHQLTMQPIK